MTAQQVLDLLTAAIENPDLDTLETFQDVIVKIRDDLSKSLNPPDAATPGGPLGGGSWGGPGD